MLILVLTWIGSVLSNDENVYCQAHVEDFSIYELDAIIGIKGRNAEITVQMTSWDDVIMWSEQIVFESLNQWNFIRLLRKEHDLQIVSDLETTTKPISMYSNIQLIDGQYDIMCTYHKQGIKDITDFQATLAKSYIPTKEFSISFWIKYQEKHRSYKTDHLTFMTHTLQQNHELMRIFELDLDFDQIEFKLNQKTYRISLDYDELFHWSQIQIEHRNNTTTFQLLTIMQNHTWYNNDSIIDLPNGFLDFNTSNLIVEGLVLKKQPLKCSPDCQECDGFKCLTCNANYILINDQCKCPMGMVEDGTACYYPKIQIRNLESQTIYPLNKPCVRTLKYEPELSICNPQQSINDVILTTFSSKRSCPQYCTNCGFIRNTFRCLSCLPNIQVYLALDGFCHICEIKNCLVCYEYSNTQLSLMNNFVYESPFYQACAQCEEGYSYNFDDGKCTFKTNDCSLSIIVNNQTKCLINTQNTSQIHVNCRDPCQVCREDQCLRCQTGYYLFDFYCLECHSAQCALNDPKFNDFWKSELHPIYSYHGKIFQQSSNIKLIHYACTDTSLIPCSIPQIKPNPLYYSTQSIFSQSLKSQDLIVLKDIQLNETLHLQALKVQLFNITTNGHSIYISTQRLYLNKIYITYQKGNQAPFIINQTISLLLEVNNVIIVNCDFTDTAIFAIQSAKIKIELIIRSLMISNTRFNNSKFLLGRMDALSYIDTNLKNVTIDRVLIVKGDNFFGLAQEFNSDGLSIINTSIIGTKIFLSSFTNCYLSTLHLQNVKLQSSTFSNFLGKQIVVKNMQISNLISKNSILFKIYGQIQIKAVVIDNSIFESSDNGFAFQLTADKIVLHNMTLLNIYGNQSLIAAQSKTIVIFQWLLRNSQKSNCPSLIEFSKFGYVNIRNIEIYQVQISSIFMNFAASNQDNPIVNITAMKFINVKVNQWQLMSFSTKILYLKMRDTDMIDIQLIDSSPMLILKGTTIIIESIKIINISYSQNTDAVIVYEAQEVLLDDSSFIQSGKQLYHAAGVVYTQCLFQDIVSDYAIQVETLQGGYIMMLYSQIQNITSVLKAVGNFKQISIDANYISLITDTIFDFQVSQQTIIQDNIFQNISGQLLKLRQQQTSGIAIIKNNQIYIQNQLSDKYLFEIYNGEVQIINIFIDQVSQLIWASASNVSFSNIVIREISISYRLMHVQSDNLNVSNFIVKNIATTQIQQGACIIETPNLNVRNASIRNQDLFFVFSLDEFNKNKCHMCGDISGQSQCLFNHEYNRASFSQMKEQFTKNISNQLKIPQMRLKLKQNVRTLQSEQIIFNDTLSHYKVNQTFYLPTGDMSTYQRLNLNKQTYIPYELYPSIILNDENNTTCSIQYLDKNISFIPNEIIPLNLTITKKQIQFKGQCMVNNRLLRLDFNVKIFPCQIGEVVRNGQCMPCDTYQYSLNTKDHLCQNIDEQTMYSVNKALINLKEGYWRPNLLSSRVTKCTDNRCQGGWQSSDVSCAQGYLGAACNECDLYNRRGDGKFTQNSNHQCVPCSWDRYKFIESVLLISIQLIFIYITVDSYQQDIQRRKVIRLTQRMHTPLLKLQLDRNEIILKLLKDYFQKILYTNAITLSSFITLNFSLMYFANSSISLNQSLECLISDYVSQEYIIYLTLPMLILIQIMIFNLFLILLFCYNIKQKNKFTIVQISTCVFYLALFNITNYFNLLMALISPKLISGINWVQANLSYRYDSELHQMMTLFRLVPQTVIICIIAPLLLYLLLRKARNTGESSLNRMLQYFTIQYRQSTYFWEIGVIWVRLFIIINMKMFIDNLYARIFMFLLVLHIVQKISTHFKPYNLYVLNSCDSLLRNLLCIAIIIMGLIETQYNQKISFILQTLFYLVNIIGILRITYLMMKIMQRKNSPVYSKIASKVLSQKYVSTKSLQQSQSIVNFQKLKLNPKLKSLVLLNRQVYNSSVEAIMNFTSDLAQTSLNITMRNTSKSANTSPQLEEMAVISPQLEEEFIKEKAKFATFRKFSYENPQEYE